MRSGAGALTIRPSKPADYKAFGAAGQAVCFYGLPCLAGCCQHQGGVILEENQGYVIRRTILFDNKCGFVLGENPKAPNPM